MIKENVTGTLDHNCNIAACIPVSVSVKDKITDDNGEGLAISHTINAMDNKGYRNQPQTAIMYKLEVGKDK